MFRAYLAWNLQQRLGVKIEQYGPNGAYTRIPGMPEDLLSFWSKRRKEIIAKAGELGIPVRGNASRLAGVNKLTRAGKSHDNDPEIRHRRWRGEAEGFGERATLIAGITGNEVDIPRERIRELTEQLDALPAYLAREEAVFRRPDMVEAAANRAAGLLGREAVVTAIERVRRNPEIEVLELPKATAESNAGMAHTERYSTRHNLGMEQAVRDMAGDMAADSGHALPVRAMEAKVATLLSDGYPLSEEQIAAIRFATARGARVAVIEGAAGSGKTTTLRPITDLHREHGYEIVPTAVAWRTAVALGNDCEARPFCVDKLLKLAARGQIEIGKDTLIVVDEAGMLSTRQAHHILQLSERHGAKIVFAGDTRQQQPVEAGPGLRLIRDVAGSVRVDRIRRQKPDLEDVLVHVHGEAPETARFQAGLTGREERDRALSEYEALPDAQKSSFTPWQVTASEALRDGDAAAAIEALRVRGRFHICHDEENTLTRLVEDWARGVREEPGKSSIVLARTRAETRALSHLMRERHLAGKADTARVIVEVSRNAEDGRIIEPLEIAVGDRLRIGATQWEKQLFNGTIVTVEKFRVLRGGGRRSVDGNGHGSEPMGPSVEITARTDDGREVIFRHDEIRDWHDNIRLDYGYALTIASAQGLTVDRAYLLADDRPARETIYPAATRHREGLDIYVNRAPLALAVAERRPEDQDHRPVMDADIRAHLAERWSRSQPKEAALDYITDGAWRDQRENTNKQEHGARAPGAAANDNALNRIAGEIRRTAFGWRHGQAVAAFADGRREVLAAYDDLRERTRAEGDAVALGSAFRETLTRHGMLLKQAESFRARPAEFGDLLAERGSIGRKDLDAFQELHARASHHRRAAMMRHVHRIRREAEPAPTQRPEAVPAPEPPAWRSAYDALARDWNALSEGARQSSSLSFYSRGYAELIPRIRALAKDKDIPSETRAPMIQALENHERHVSTRKKVEDWFIAAERHMDRRDSLEDTAANLDVPVAEAPEYPDWRGEAERLTAVGKAILSETETYRAHLANITRGETRMKWGLSDLGDATREIAEERAGRTAREQPIEPVRDWSYWNELAEDARLGAGPIFGSDIGSSVPPDTTPAGGTRVEGTLSRLRRTFGWEDSMRKLAEADMRRAQSRWEELRQDWNREVEQAKQAGIHVIYTRDYQYLRRDLESMANDTHIGRDLSPAIDDALAQLDKAEASRKHIEEYRDSIVKCLADRRDRLEAKAAVQGVTVPEHKDYGIWRAAIDQAVDIGERIIANRGADNIHFAGVALRGEGLGAAISRAREALRDDDRQISRAAQRERQAERAAIRKDGYAHILEDPEAHRKRLEEAMKREHEASQKQGKGLGMGM